MTLPPLVIEYVFEGHKRGYNFTSPTRGYDDDALRVIWRSAMPRGQGWGQYIGARSIKAFPLPDDRIALAEAVVTDQADEGGRRGIRRVTIEALTARQFTGALQSRLASYPAEARGIADFRVKTCAREIDRAIGRFRRDPQAILIHPYRGGDDWQAVEAMILSLALNPTGTLKRIGSPLSFTTLALDYRDESRIVALPAEKSDTVDAAFVRMV